MEENPFSEMHIDDASFLDSVESRCKCPKCGRSRKFYCYSCFIPLGSTLGKYPKLQLPVKVDIIKHPNETDGKSTAIHAAILAPDSVNIYTFPCIPDYKHTTGVVLVCPGPGAVSLEALSVTTRTNIPDRDSVTKGVKDGFTRDDPASPQSKLTMKDGSTGTSRKRSLPIGDEGGEADCTQGDSKHRRTSALPIHTVVFIDSTWQQLNKIAGDARLSGLRKVELKSQKTKFWRHQTDKPDTYLATIEAIYYFFKEFHQHFISSTYSGEYDNLLFLFRYMYSKIKVLFDEGKPIRAYNDTKPRQGNKTR